MELEEHLATMSRGEKLRLCRQWGLAAHRLSTDDIDKLLIQLRDRERSRTQARVQSEGGSGERNSVT